jgi:predicted heme/steroid binding protein
MQEPEPLTSAEELASLDIIDFGRLGGYFDSPFEAARACFNTIAPCCYIDIRVDCYFDVPEASGWSGWDHAGRHEAKGKDLYNFVNAHPHMSKIRFSDCPDFDVEIHGNLYKGDIGKVSTYGFVFGAMGAPFVGGGWLTVQGRRHVLIERTRDFNLFG